jgi:hypothetical protein
MHNRNFFHSKWICSIENILNECGYSEYWLTQNVPLMNLPDLLKITTFVLYI